jgi:hypothetical protein
MRVVSMASGRVIAGRMVVSRRASIDVPVPGSPRSRTLGHNACISFCFTRAASAAVGQHR